MSDAIEVVREVEIEAPPERVFRSLTDPDEIPLWWGDDDAYRTTEAEVDLRPGGRYRFAGTTGDDRPFEVTGTYRAVEAPMRLVYTWTPSWDRGARDSLVEITLLEATPSGTGVRVVHTAFDSEKARDEHADGWPRVLAWLKEHAEG